MIVTSTARVSTERPARYAKQLTSHLGEKLSTTWDPESDRGSIVLMGKGADHEDERFAFDGSATCDLVAGDGVLLLHIEAPAELVERFESVIGRHLAGFARHDTIRIAFRRGDGSEGLFFESV
ncbi:hypothetical protein CDES_05270 [Corynebacterium deserti GIMN1.010]|uniref:DUF2218 domain-containing protein n=1 Tax=Corynebacterium deserti GIMN1.010 TaxID=931089 RepID=A0A0M4CDC6_9CORY|nr:DUF2218 domain-containing protein [Corynebacterium deserti]ALC05491.1 hypothetical protein CDES_05270 [Corynebacterium deserti GIMN1.010]